MHCCEKIDVCLPWTKGSPVELALPVDGVRHLAGQAGGRLPDASPVVARDVDVTL